VDHKETQYEDVTGFIEMRNRTGDGPLRTLLLTLGLHKLAWKEWVGGGGERGI
jgi:hypothetical protein